MLAFHLVSNVFLCPAQVEFSDESDPEADPHVEVKEKAEASKKRPASSRKACVLKAAPEPPVKTVLPRRPARGKKSTVLPLSCSSSEEEGRGTLTPARPARRGRSKTTPSGPEAGEDPENMRTIEEETEGTLDSSIEELRASDTETEENRLSGENLLEHLMISCALAVASYVKTFAFVYNLSNCQYFSLWLWMPQTQNLRSCGRTVVGSVG